VLCYRCGSHVPDTSDTCPTCGLKFDAAARQAAGASARKRGGVEGLPYKPGETLAGRYLIKELIGAGPVGVVFRAQDQMNDVDVALKVINPRLLQEPEERTQFSLVLRVGKKLSHPHLLRVYEEGFEQDRPFFTTQMVEGMTLRRMMEMRVAKGQPFTLREVEPLLAQLAAAIDAAHRYGPHSDLKPENIIVLPDMLKVTDYGLALGIPRPPFVQAQKGFRAEGYIAPEYISGGEIDARMDIYSLAAIVGEMLTGLMPDGDGIPELLMKNPDLPPAFEALYRRALNANPTARPRTAGEFASEFSSIASKGAAMTSRPGKQGPPVAQSALAATARMAEKPPPPVPTDQLPIASVSPPVMMRPALQDDVPPVDATQPMDAAMLAAIMGTPPAAAPKPGAPSKPAESRPAMESRSGKASPREPAAPPPPPPPVPADSLPTDPRGPTHGAEAAPASARAPGKAEARPRPKQSKEKPQTILWMVLLTIAGLAVGSAGGYLLLKRIRANAKAGTGTPEVTQPVTGQPDPSPAGAVDPMAPASSCPAGMKVVPGGAFKMGTSPEEEPGFDERQLVSVQVASFCIDEYEFPNQVGVRPMVNVTWWDAKQACEKVGKRLCTEEQWEKACKGPGNSRFPYGNEFNADTCNTADASDVARPIAESGRFKECRSIGYGVADLSGNVAEWTASPIKQDLAVMTQKGGNSAGTKYAARCSYRVGGAAKRAEDAVGFRCCAGVQP
jgi:serine/threonine protein kinase/formylglycine-generating enzyme required for sulfatase activity